MRPEIITFILGVCKKYKFPLSLSYYPAGYQDNKFDIYSVNLKGRSVVNFTGKNFYDLPKAMRETHFLPLIKIGMSHNLGENSLKEQVEIPRQMGIRVIRDGALKYGV